MLNLCDDKIFPVTNKIKNIRLMNRLMLNKTLGMFEYKGLPETIPQRELEKLLQMGGYAFITEHEDKLYAFSGGLGGEIDTYGNYTQIVISNPYLKLHKTFNFKEDGVLFYNDDLLLGIGSYFNKQNTLLVENDINMLLWGYNTRIQSLITASDDKTRENAEKYLEKIVDGELGILLSNALFDGIKTHPTNNKMESIKSMVEYHQYLKSNLYNEVGLSSNFNMKKERLISSELDQSEDSLFPLVYGMMRNRQDSLRKINDKYGLNITIEFGSVWYHKNKDIVGGLHDDQYEKNINFNSESDESDESDEKVEVKEEKTLPKGVEGVEGVEGAEGVEGVKGVEGIEGAEGVEGVEGDDLVNKKGTEGVEGDDLVNKKGDDLVNKKGD